MRKKLLELFITFFKIGAFTFGGGYAMISLVQHEIVDKRSYITEEEFINIIAIAEATPGVIAVNTATFVGYKIAGIPGGCIATVGVVLPSFIIISIVSRVYAAFRQIAWIDWAFSGIRAGVIVLILGVLIKMVKKSERHWLTLFIAIGAFIIAGFTEISCVYVILAGALIGIMRSLFLMKKKESEHSGGDSR